MKSSAAGTASGEKNNNNSGGGSSSSSAGATGRSALQSPVRHRKSAPTSSSTKVRARDVLRLCASELKPAAQESEEERARQQRNQAKREAYHANKAARMQVRAWFALAAHLLSGR